MNKQTIITVLLTLVAITFASCGSSEPEWADPETREKTEQLRKQYGSLMVGTWHYEKVGENQRFFEKLTFKDDGIFTGIRKWQTRKLVNIDGQEQYADWEDFELNGTFTGTWSLRYWAPDGGEKGNYLQLTATYDGEERNYMAYSACLFFGYADETILHIQGYYVHDDDGLANYKRGEVEPSF
jgi:hypothetical protein